jgi:hypothetical protein
MPEKSAHALSSTLALTRASRPGRFSLDSAEEKALVMEWSCAVQVVKNRGVMVGSGLGLAVAGRQWAGLGLQGLSVAQHFL